jgi:hypothetical protein
MADHYNVRFIETSARDSKNVEQAFITMAREIKERVSISKQTLNPARNVGLSTQKLG